MSRRRFPGRIRAAALLVLVAACLAGTAPALGAGICEEAFVRCFYDPDIIQFFNFMGSGGMFCAAGYVFCRTYVEPILV